MPEGPSYPYTSCGERGAVPVHRNDHDVTNSVQTTDSAAVGAEIIRLYHGLFPHASARPLELAFTHVAQAYDGGDLSYWPCDTEYHDIQHVLDVTLAMARLLDGYERSRGDGPQIDRELFQLGVICALFHDCGYIRKSNDTKHENGAANSVSCANRKVTFLLCAFG